MVTTLGAKGRIAGVCKDFHFESLHTAISPVIFVKSVSNLNYIAIRVQSDNITNTIAYIKRAYAQVDPSFIFEYSFLDNDINALYKSEANFFRVFTIFSGLAIFIACLGIFGLAAFTASQKTKEIGVRKVLGASVQHISFLLTKEFIKLVLAANLIAWPVAWFCMYKWLENFPYKTDMALWMFLLATLMALFIAVITVSFQAIKAAIGNPVKSLRTE